jgi:hypothetical protein
MYTKLSDDFCVHPKVLEVGNEAAGAFCRMLSYCGRHSDGDVPEGMALFLAGGDVGVLEKLAAVELIRKQKGGWLVVGYLNHNISREQWELQRQQNAERQRRWRQKHRNGNKPDEVDEAVRGSA